MDVVAAEELLGLRRSRAALASTYYPLPTALFLNQKFSSSCAGEYPGIPGPLGVFSARNRVKASSSAPDFRSTTIVLNASL